MNINIKSDDQKRFYGVSELIFTPITQLRIIKLEHQKNSKHFLH